jgi:hypothetical protein
MNEANSAAAFVKAPLTCRSVIVDEALRLKISVVNGCLNLPGVDAGVETVAGFGVVKPTLCACRET